MNFCPLCANCLMIEKTSRGEFAFRCLTCPYVYQIRQKVKSSIHLETKVVDDILGGKEAWENVDQTEAMCPKCGHNRAYFKQIQTRSADEPMTIFYKCCECGNQWKEG
eukprot:TRINITY_DN1466_c0_g1_i2.p1 TRINITY_DN1466_c0_g1~~TRINITY_DN1466_c0_g1_i2.p1  ORF type:complete len:108 (+),score=6.06 TRINITY_DN1466_c0_g1_i2:140-463(+)